LCSYKLGIIGCGNMGEAILGGILDSGFLNNDEIVSYDVDDCRREYIETNYRVYQAGGISDVIKKCRYILLSVKPKDIKTVLKEIKTYFDNKINSIISIAAGISTDYIEKTLDSNASVIRVMPNYPALFKKGMSAISRGRFTRDEDLSFTEELIKSTGDYVIIDDKYQDIATALNGSGPAYFFLFCKYLIKSGIKNGLDSEISKKLVIGTMNGAGVVIDKSGMELDDLIKKIASPGGTTERALKEFEKNKLDKIIYEAVESAKKKAYELQNLLD
jgi:pyrroline-5-carboxylate reductase